LAKLFCPFLQSHKAYSFLSPISTDFYTTNDFVFSTFKMTMAETTLTTLAPICYLLDKLPVELRLNIYKYYFEGSRVQATLAKDNKSSSAKHTTRAVLRYSKHFGLLLSCRTVYNEALDTYWSETVLRLKCPPLIFTSLRAFSPTKLKIDTYCHRLCASLPEPAKANVRHVRGMVLPALRSTWVEENPSLTASALLGTFKKLATCEITPTLAHPVDGLVTHFEDLKDESYSRFKMIMGYEPAEFLSERYGLNNIDEVAFFLKGNIKYSVRMNDNNVEVLKGSKRIRVC